MKRKSTRYMYYSFFDSTNTMKALKYSLNSSILIKNFLVFTLKKAKMKTSFHSVKNSETKRKIFGYQLLLIFEKEAMKTKLESV